MNQHDGPKRFLGLGIGLLAVGALWWHNASEESRDWIKNGLWSLADGLAEQQRRNQYLLEQQAHELPDRYVPAVVTPEPTRMEQPPTIVTDVELVSWLTHPCVTLILGRRGSGKTVAGFRILELCRFRAACYVVGWDESTVGLLPEWIGSVTDLRDLPPNSIALVDESYLSYHALDHSSRTSRDLSATLNLSRQRLQSLIFIGQEARQLDRYIVSASEAFLITEPGPLQVETDRKELKTIIERSVQVFGAVGGSRLGLVFALIPGAGFEGLVTVSKPEQWPERLSNAFGAKWSSASSRPARDDKEDRSRVAKLRKSEGRSLQEIADELGVSKSTAHNLVNDYPYKTDRDNRDDYSEC